MLAIEVVSMSLPARELRERERDLDAALLSALRYLAAEFVTDLTAELFLLECAYLIV